MLLNKGKKPGELDSAGENRPHPQMLICGALVRIPRLT
ncbi:hypothetical protein BLJAPNOD_01616 [Ensifer sp. M14]|nr:hypothetical protein BLJAPNOD_01616 [Ensifer sp. M14]